MPSSFEPYVPAPEVSSDLAEVVIRAVAYGGDGVGQLPDGITAFVPFSAVGDRLRVRVVERHRRFARCAIETVIEPGRGRVTPPCPYYGTCGGCRYQHLAAEEQVRLKVEQLRDLLMRVGGISALPEIEQPVPAPAAYGYRNKITLSPQMSGGRIAGWGYVGLDNKTIVPIQSCPLAHADLNVRLAGLLKSGNAERFRTVDRKAPLVLRRSAAGEVIAFREPLKQLLVEMVLDHEMLVPAGSFFQVNPPILDRLTTWLREVFPSEPADALVDAYCGCGVFAVCLGELATGVVIGIESDSGAISCAEKNARNAGLRRFRFIVGEVEKKLEPILREAGAPARVALLLDPPRTGCSPAVLEAVLRSRPRTVHMISCNASTLARDLGRLCIGSVFAIERLALFDMFPQTAHFEAAAVLRAI